MKISTKNITLKDVILVIVTLIVGILGGSAATNIVWNGEEATIEVKSNTLELSEEQVPAIIETDEGTIEADVPTVEAVDNAEAVEECGEGEECGQGWWVDTSTPQTFSNATYGQCVDTDGHYGSQCWDLGNLFWQNYAGRTLSTCGTGAAKGTLNCYEYNAGSEFEMVWDSNSLQAGDWVIFTNGQYGHIGMAMGDSNNGYIALLGTNQGGKACSGGGSTANIINISLKNFGGAFRPKSYIKVEPVAPEIPITGCVEWGVERGDTMSKIMLECEGTIVYGEAMNQYADSWVSRIIKPGQTVLQGWHSESGVGLYESDIIDHKTN